MMRTRVKRSGIDPQRNSTDGSPLADRRRRLNTRNGTDEFLDLSRTVAADLADEFRDNPRGELAAWLHIALEREGVVASLYQRHSVESRFAPFPKRLARAAIALVSGVCANEEKHVAAIRALLDIDRAWPRATLKESWGRLQGMVLNQLAGSNAIVRALAPIVLTLGTRSHGERAAASAVAELDACGFLKLSRTLEITAVESYQRIIALLTGPLRPENGPPYSLPLHLQMLGILRDERVHRDVFHVLYRTFGNAADRRRARKAVVTELPDWIATRPISGPAELKEVCRAILSFHYGAAVPFGAPPDEVMRAAVDYWRWQMENPVRKSYLVERQRQEVFGSGRGMLLLGTAGLDDVARGMRSVRAYTLDQGVIPWFMTEGDSMLRPRSPVLSLGTREPEDGMSPVTKSNRGCGAPHSPAELHRRRVGVGSRANVPPN